MRPNNKVKPSNSILDINCNFGDKSKDRNMKIKVNKLKD